MTGPDAGPRLSVVIPTHDRRQLLGRALAALTRQTVDPATFEVIVVCDGCTDGTADMLRVKSFPFTLRLVEQQECCGPARARNAGAKVAIGDLLLFLDDDVEPVAGFIEAHQRAHESEEGALIVLGPYPPVPQASSDLFRLLVRAWWTKHFEDLADQGHRFSFRDHLTGNLSLPAHIWEQLGGLDPSFRAAREDYELGVRLMCLGLPFRFAADAMGHHHEYATMTMRGSFRRKREEGRSDVLLGRKHPQVRSELRITVRMLQSSRVTRCAYRLIFAVGSRADPLVYALAYMLPLLGRMRWRRAYFALYRGLNTYWYLNGAAEILESWSAWRDFAQNAPLPRPTNGLDVDLKGGIDAAEQAIDRTLPDEVTLRYGDKEVGTLECEAGAEPWRGRHLRPLLCGRLASAYLKCLVEAGELEGVLPSCRSAVEQGLAKAGAWIGLPRRKEMWSEQSRQWQVLISENGRLAVDRALAGRSLMD